MSDSLQIVIVTAVLSFIGTSVATVIAYLIYFRKNKAEAVGAEGKNRKQELEILDFGNDLLNEQASMFKPILKENRELIIKNSQLETELELQKILKLRAEGAKDEAIRQRDGLVSEVSRLSDRVDEMQKRIGESERLIKEVGDLKKDIEKFREILKSVQSILQKNKIDFDFQGLI